MQAGSPNTYFDITLNNSSNNFIGLVDVTGGNVVLADRNDIALGNTIAAGTYTITGNGAIADFGVINIIGKASFAVGPLNDITLANNDHFFSMVEVISARNVVLREADSLALGTSTISGNLAVTSGTVSTGNGVITDYGALTVGGIATFSAGAANITLDSANNFASVVISSSKNVVVNDVNALNIGAGTISGNLLVTTTGGVDLAAMNVAGTLNLNSGHGAITDSGAVIVSGSATFAAGTADISLDNANDFTSVVISSGKNVVLNDQNALTIAVSAIGGDLSLTTGGNLDQSGSLVVGGSTKISSMAAGVPSTFLMSYLITQAMTLSVQSV